MAVPKITFEIGNVIELRTALWKFDEEQDALLLTGCDVLFVGAEPFSMCKTSYRSLNTDFTLLRRLRIAMLLSLVRRVLFSHFVRRRRLVWNDRREGDDPDDGDWWWIRRSKVGRRFVKTVNEAFS
ncbi:unnamed protein product [Nesidiocoris tenuis]|uniref:Uncharacterized protein n=1 Tax=Nesidiocoris tenuis TaxID=355587 RepID=A0A6H5GXG7_9HEMI|nr:unnamed protein product [Nesidiocoris tenuis]